MGADHAQEGWKHTIGWCKPVPGSVLQKSKDSGAVTRIVHDEDTRYRETGNQVEGQERRRGRWLQLRLSNPRVAMMEIPQLESLSAVRLRFSQMASDQTRLLILPR